MKRALVILLATVALTSCNQYSCPTYGENGGRSFSGSAKKSKPSKGKEPYYKSVKRAEQ